jgi:hypothetical protein
MEKVGRRRRWKYIIVYIEAWEEVMSYDFDWIYVAQLRCSDSL